MPQSDYTIQDTGEDHNRPAIYKAGQLVAGPFTIGTRVEIYEVDGHTFADIWRREHGFNRFSHTTQLD